MGPQFLDLDIFRTESPSSTVRHESPSQQILKSKHVLESQGDVLEKSQGRHITKIQFKGCMLPLQIAAVDANKCKKMSLIQTRVAHPNKNPTSVGANCFRDNLEKVFSPSNWVRGVSQYGPIGFGSINPDFGDF